MNIRWPAMHQTTESVSSTITHQEGLWVTSKSLLEQYPALKDKNHYLVERADLTTLIDLQNVLTQWQPQHVIAIGGGKVIDIAKLAVQLGPINESSAAVLLKRSWIDRAEKTPVRLTAIPTTVGSGSEVSEVGVLTIEGKKVPLHHSELLPDQVIMNVHAVSGAPMRVIWNGIWDTFVHALESALSPLATELTRRWSYDALRYTIQIVSQLKEGQALSESVWAQALWSCALAGKAQSVVSVGLIHALSHQVEQAGQWPAIEPLWRAPVL